MTYTDDNNNYAKIATKLTNSIYQIKLHTKSLVDKIEFRMLSKNTACSITEAGIIDTFRHLKNQSAVVVSADFKLLYSIVTV